MITLKTNKNLTLQANILEGNQNIAFFIGNHSNR